MRIGGRGTLAALTEVRPFTMRLTTLTPQPGWSARCFRVMSSGMRNSSRRIFQGLVARASDRACATRLYGELAEWWPLIGDPAAEYAVEAGIYADQLAEACDGPIESLLELGSGGGNNALHMKRRFSRLLLTDVSHGMLTVSRALNPDREHRHGDMRRLRVGRTFDAVFVHDAVCYMTTEADLRRAMETAWVHCRPGGAVLFAPDHVRENFPGAVTDDGGCDESPAPRRRIMIAPGRPLALQ